MTRSIRIVLLLVAGVCLLSTVGNGGEAAAPPASGGPQVAKIVTSDGRMLVGEVLEDTKDGVKMLDLRSGAEVALSIDTIKVRENALGAQEAIKWVGLPTYLSWRIKKESDINPKGKIITVTPTTIYLSLGQRDGVDKGDKVYVYRESETLSDPDTGEVLGKVRARIGELEVIEVQDKFSKAKRLPDLEVEFKAGDVAETASTKKAVAVFPIVPAKDDQKEMAMLVTERLTTELASHGVPVVERALLDHALIEMGLQTTALVDQDKAVKLGQLIGAQSVLTGTLGSVEAGRVEVHARLVKVSTGEVLVAGSEELRVEVPKKKEEVQPARPAAQAGVAPAAPAPQDTANADLTDKLRTRVTLRPPYPKTTDQATTTKISVQHAVIEIAAQVGLGYDWDTSFKNTNPTCGNWIHPDIRNVTFSSAMDNLLGAQGLTYSVVNNQVVLRRK